MQAQASQSSPLFLYVFPILGLLLGILVTWFLLRSLLHLSLTLAGSRGKSILSGNLAGWSTMPLIFRSLVRIVAMLTTKTAISAKGLSGLITSTTTCRAICLGIACFDRSLFHLAGGAHPDRI